MWSGFDKVVPSRQRPRCCAARLTGQVPVENGRSFPLAASADALPETLDRVDAMLSAGELDIAAVQGDTMIRGRAVERLAQVYEGLPVFGAQVVRQMDGRAVISVTGRLYGALDMNVAPSISSQRANEIAMSAAPSGAQIPGETTLGIVPVEGGYRLAYRMLVRSDRNQDYAGPIPDDRPLDQRHSFAGCHRPGQRRLRRVEKAEHAPGVRHLPGRRQAPAGRSLHTPVSGDRQPPEPVSEYRRNFQFGCRDRLR
jgi:hypothetical protein